MQSVMFMSVLLLVLVALALGMLAVLALSRRSAADWRTIVRENVDHVADRAQHSSVSDLERESLEDALGLNPSAESAYFDPTTLPGYDRLEAVTVRIHRAGMELRSRA
ncbi:hypothetical protein I6B53_06645 [Schaalia sp. 19OD2882]|uniref:hypothetical protein n=1 Tax=Schaalia sp. 19OD2882 TaxID=2794089 RepID=UPI001C1EFE58|nr:hypothetical protein [Schaalia sp. 19OD2882]QWW18831.1 hypothetical protein I6B53_06645 [Schaalia sp. 19OD2882]